MAGVFYLFIILTGIPGVVVLLQVLVPDDAAATAANLVAEEAAVRLAFAVYLLSTAGYLVVTGLLFALLRPVSPEISLIAALFSVVGCAVMAASMLFLEAPLLVLDGSHSAALGAPATQALALLFLQFHIAGFGISMVFFGFYCMTIGWLVYRSGFLPRLVGILMSIGGLGYLSYLSPPLVHSLFPLNVLPGFVGEAALTLWLLLRGVDAERWTERARMARGFWSNAG
ncbi:MAG: DUF4386 domain-containing protein [Sphingomicrobium sp.]